MSDFRITVHLHQFFVDHRSSCRLYITSKIKTIQDLEEHISKIFELNASFYLTSNQLYLPSSENIRILKEDDTIIAVPCNPLLTYKDASNFETNAKSVLSNEKKCKRKRGVNETDVSVDVASTPIQLKKKKTSHLEDGSLIAESTPIVSKKKKKSKDFNIEISNVDHIEPHSFVEKKKKKKKKKDKDEDKTNDATDVTKHKNKNIEKEIKNDCNGCVASEIINIDTKLNTVKEDRVSKKKNIEPMEISTIPKIVKSVIVYDSPLPIPYINSEDAFIASIQENNEKPITVKRDPVEILDHEVEKSDYILRSNEMLNKIEKNDKIIQLMQSYENKIDAMLNPEQSKTNVPVALAQSIIAVKLENGNTQPLLNNTEQDIEINENGNINPTTEKSNGEAVESTMANDKINIISIETIDAQPNNQDTSENEDDRLKESTSIIGPTQVPSELLSSVVADESSMDQSLTERTKRKRKRVRKRKPKLDQQMDLVQPYVYPQPVITTSSSVVHIRFGEEDKVAETATAVEECSNIIDVEANYDKLCRDEIRKFPIMNYKLPKQGDIIAFKMYVLSKSYTPEISDYIIAKVLNYCSDTTKVSLKVVEGVDQLILPEGKFHLKYSEDVINHEDNEFLWGELFDQRLLFP